MRERPTVLMIGPALSVRGGVSTVERILIEARPGGLPIAHVATMVEGTTWRKIRRFLRALIHLFLRVRRGDIVHIHFASDGSNRRKMIVARLALRRGAHVIMHAHGGAYHKFWQRMPRVERAYTSSTLRRVRKLLVLGEDWREFFVSIGVPREKIAVLPNPVVLPQRMPKRFPGPRVQFVYLGLIAPRKGTFELVEAIARLPPEVFARVHVVIAGNGAVAQLRAFVGRLGIDKNVEVREWISAEERDELLASADAFVLPSHAEGLPMSLLEAMAWAVPPICTPVGSIAEYVSHRVNGLLVQPGAIDELAAAIELMVRDEALRAQMAQQARSAVEPLDARAYAEKIAAVYRSAAGEGIVADAHELSTRRSDSSSPSDAGPAGSWPTSLHRDHRASSGKH